MSGKSKGRSSTSKSKGERSSGSAKKRSGARKRSSSGGKSSGGKSSGGKSSGGKSSSKPRGKASKGGKRTTGKQRAVKAQAAGGPSPAIAVGIGVAVIGMLAVALMIATGGSQGGGEAPSPSHSPIVAPTQIAVASPSAAPSRARPEPSASPEPSEPPQPGKVDRGEVNDLLAELEGDKGAPASAKAQDAPSGQPAGSQLKGEHEDVGVKRVVDGDTFVTDDGRKIRMIGINTPEKGRPFNKDATNFLKDLITGKTVTIEFGSEKKGRYGRYLAYVHMGDLFVSAEIVRRGLAYAYIYPKTKLHNEQLIACQREAREAKRGLWSLPLPEPADHYIGNYRAPYFHREGCHRIKKLRKSNRRDYKTRNEALDAGMNPCVDCKS